MRRVGSLGVKLGMTTFWDKWGAIVPATAILLDRVQVIQIRDGPKGFKHVQMGFGEANLKRITKSMLGHYMKARVPPKRRIA